MEHNNKSSSPSRTCQPLTSSRPTPTSSRRTASSRDQSGPTTSRHPKVPHPLFSQGTRSPRRRLAIRQSRLARQKDLHQTKSRCQTPHSPLRIRSTHRTRPPPPRQRRRKDHQMGTPTTREAQGHQEGQEGRNPQGQLQNHLQGGNEGPQQNRHRSRCCLKEESPMSDQSLNI